LIQCRLELRRGVNALAIDGKATGAAVLSHGLGEASGLRGAHHAQLQAEVTQLHLVVVLGDVLRLPLGGAEQLLHRVTFLTHEREDFRGDVLALHQAGHVLAHARATASQGFFPKVAVHQLPHLRLEFTIRDAR